MIKKSVNLTKFRQEAAEILKPLDKPGSKDAIQLVHRGSTVKVVITQEHYFQWFQRAS